MIDYLHSKLTIRQNDTIKVDQDYLCQYGNNVKLQHKRKYERKSQIWFNEYI